MNKKTDTSKQFENPKRLEFTIEQVMALIDRVDQNKLEVSDHPLISDVMRSMVWLSLSLDAKKLTIHRLSKIFGFQTERTRNLPAPQPDTNSTFEKNPSSPTDLAEANANSTNNSGSDNSDNAKRTDSDSSDTSDNINNDNSKSTAPDPDKPVKPTRNGNKFSARDYKSAIVVKIAHKSLKLGCRCPDCQVHYLWGSWQIGVIMGLSIGVASTVVLVRVLENNNLLNTLQGHIAVGWLIVEDMLTVAVLVLLPMIVAILNGTTVSFLELLEAMGVMLLKFIVLVVLMFTLGRRFVSFALFKIAQTRSPELFTLAVLALTCLIATGSAIIFGTSIALGAFIAGMVIGQTDVSHQASAYSSPMKDAFVVIFFLSVGMLFNPVGIWDNFSLFIGLLAIVLIVKPLAAYVITVLMRYPKMVGTTIALALAQIGEFSFILAEEAGRYNIFPDEGYDAIVPCAIVTISINPLLFKIMNY